MSLPRTMRLFSRPLGVLALTPWALTAFVGCSGGPGRLDPPSIDAAAAGQQAIEEYDANHDGAIDGAELDKAPALQYGLKKLDPTGSGRVTADAITARVNAWRDSKLALAQPIVSVYMQGQPLVDAEVKFVPEKFLGPNVVGGQGKTGATGMAVISGPAISKNGMNYQGVSCGYYRIEITKDEGGKQIVPDRYNTHTTLGVEIANDSQALQRPTSLVLK